MCDIRQIELLNYKLLAKLCQSDQLPSWTIPFLLGDLYSSSRGNEKLKIPNLSQCRVNEISAILQLQLWNKRPAASRFSIFSTFTRRRKYYTKQHDREWVRKMENCGDSRSIKSSSCLPHYFSPRTRSFQYLPSGGREISSRPQLPLTQITR